MTSKEAQDRSKQQEAHRNEKLKHIRRINNKQQAKSKGKNK